LLLKVVAVAGRRVPHQLLAAVAGLDHRQLDGALRAAVTSQLLARSGQEGYDLRHALLREVIDADLVPGERVRLYAALAHTLANLLGSGELDWSDSAAEVAAHWGRARDLSKALEWSVRAAFASSALASRPPRWPPGLAACSGRSSADPPTCPSCFRSFPQRVGDRTDASRPRPRGP